MEKFSESSVLSREFYYYLGLLSTKFAKVENNLMAILGKLVTNEFFLINIVIEKNSLSQNLDLLKKLNLYREFEIDVMQKMVEKLSALRSMRNLFIHALWGQPFEKNGRVFISCLEPKVTPKMVTHGRMWTSGKEHEFELSFLIEKIEELDLIIKMQKSLLAKL